MGGNAVKEFNPIRLPMDEAYAIGCIWRWQLTALCNKHKIYTKPRVIAAYENKETAGDIDLIVPLELLSYFDIEQIITPMSYVEGFEGEQFEYVQNTNVYSIAHPLRKDKSECFQVDLIFIPEEDMGFAEGYFAYNDLGNLVGRVAHNMGLKFGHNGLWYPYREGSHMIKEILVCKSFPMAMEFLGFSIDRWNLGFESLEDIYEYVAKSDRFCRNFYPLEHRSHVARIRDRKRPTYTGFLKWLDAHPEFEDKQRYCERDERHIWMDEIKKKFPLFAKELEAEQVNYDLKQTAKKYWNGDIVRELVGLEGKALGEFMKAFVVHKGLQDTMDMVEYVVESTLYPEPNPLYLEVKEFYETYALQVGDGGG